MRVLVAMSGGVDSSVAAALLLEEGHEVTGVTLKLWGGESDSGCCSVSDVDDARRVAQQLGIDHWVFNFGDEFRGRVVDAYVADHAAGRTPNPCIECNRHVKFDRLLARAHQLGFEALATGHHVRRVRTAEHRWALRRALDAGKDQSYVLYMLGQQALEQCLFPVGEMTKDEVRRRAAGLGLRTAAKPDSQDVCFVARAAGGRRAFLSARIPLRPARVVTAEGVAVGRTDAVELVTIGQRRGLGVAGGGDPLFAIAIDAERGEVVVGPEADLLAPAVALRDLSWADGPRSGPVQAQCSAHGRTLSGSFDAERSTLTWDSPQRRVAPGQIVALYEGDVVLGGGIAT